MAYWRSCDNCADRIECWCGESYPLIGTCDAWEPIPCQRCGGPLSELRKYRYGGGPIGELAKHSGKWYRHCYSCHGEFFEEE